MQEQRRRCRLEFHLLSLSFAAAACGSAPATRRVASASEDEAPSAGFAPAAISTSRDTPPALGSPPTAWAAEAVSPGASAETMPTGTLVLHVGDSFAAALGLPLAKRLRAVGLRNVVEFKTASYIPTWAFGSELGRFVSHYNPDLVLITLGANEIEIPDPPQRARAIRKIVETLGARPCIWISPPLWKKDTGLLAIIRQNVAPCRYLDSDSLVHGLPRGPDKIHPSAAGREAWAEAVFAWLARARDPEGERPWALRAEGPDFAP